MAEGRQRGHVLWLMLMLLGLLAELAVGSLQLAARDGLQAAAEAGEQQRDAEAEALARALEALPVPSPGVADLTRPWHPGSSSEDMTSQGCGLGPEPGYAGRCDWPVAGDLMASAESGLGWHWQLFRLPDEVPDDAGTDYQAFPQLRPQHWRLQVVVTGVGGRRAGWRYDYRQQAEP